MLSCRRQQGRNRPEWSSPSVSLPPLQMWHLASGIGGGKERNLSPFSRLLNYADDLRPSDLPRGISAII